MTRNDLPKRTVGRTRLQVTALGYGGRELRGSRIRGGRSIEDDQAGEMSA